jgi:hypothetical protein
VDLNPAEKPLPLRIVMLEEVDALHVNCFDVPKDVGTRLYCEQQDVHRGYAIVLGESTHRRIAYTAYGTAKRVLSVLQEMPKEDVARMFERASKGIG